MLADASLLCASLGGTLGLADASLCGALQRGVLLSDTLLLADALLRG